MPRAHLIESVNIPQPPMTKTAPNLGPVSTSNDDILVRGDDTTLSVSDPWLSDELSVTLAVAIGSGLEVIKVVQVRRRKRKVRR